MIGDTVSALYQSHHGGLWIGTIGGALNYLKDGNIINYKLEDYVPKKAHYYAIFEDHKKGLWLGIYRYGLAYLKNGKFKLFSSKEYPELSSIYSIYEDRPNLILIDEEKNALSRVRWRILSKKGCAVIKSTQIIFNNNVGCMKDWN